MLGCAQMQNFLVNSSKEMSKETCNPLQNGVFTVCVESLFQKSGKDNTNEQFLRYLKT